MYGVLFSPLWLKVVQDWTVISVSTWHKLHLGQIVWFGWLSVISQLASMVGEGGGVGQICCHSVTQPYTTCPRRREQGGGLHSLPLVGSNKIHLCPVGRPFLYNVNAGIIVYNSMFSLGAEGKRGLGRSLGLLYCLLLSGSEKRPVKTREWEEARWAYRNRGNFYCETYKIKYGVFFTFSPSSLAKKTEVCSSDHAGWPPLVYVWYRLWTT